jgi:hypothetical protein
LRNPLRQEEVSEGSEMLADRVEVIKMQKIGLPLHLLPCLDSRDTE